MNIVHGSFLGIQRQYEKFRCFEVFLQQLDFSDGLGRIKWPAPLSGSRKLLLSKPLAVGCRLSENIHVSWNAVSIKKLPIQKRARHCPGFLSKLIDSAVQQLNPDRIWIYGSRARGDERELSDYDLAFDVSENNVAKWPVFSIDAQDEAETLHKLDLVLFSNSKAGLREKILKEGILLYEKNRTRAG